MTKEIFNNFHENQAILFISLIENGNKYKKFLFEKVPNLNDIFDLTSINRNLLFLKTEGDIVIGNNENFHKHLNSYKGMLPFLKFSLKGLKGGKGGFGANLRRQGAKHSSEKEITNFDSCKDLSGRRIGLLKDAKKVVENFKKVEKLKDKKKEKLLKLKESLRKEQEGGSGSSKALKEYQAVKKEVVSGIKEAVLIATKKNGNNNVKNDDTPLYSDSE
jgi:hypothetical protein